MTTATTERPRLALLLAVTATMAVASTGRLVVRRLGNVAASVATRAQVDALGASLGDRIANLETAVLDAVDEVSSASRPVPAPSGLGE